jgi:uncharacterized repeat protein (TIGR01451 family)
MSYTQNGDKFIYSIKVENQSSYTDTNVVTVINPLPAGIVYDSHTNTQGTFNPSTLTWTIPSIPGKTTTFLYLKVQVVNILNGPFSINVSSTGTLTDNDLGNNSTIITVGPSGGSPAGGANPDTGIYSIDVSLNDTKCTLGETEWRLNIPSIVNGTLVNWDIFTGKGLFTYTDITKAITGTYDLWCVQGVDEFHISCAVPFTSIPVLKDKDIFDHTISTIPFADLTPADIVVLTAQYPTTDLTDYCWRVLRNADGDATSGEPVECNPAADTRFIHICSEEPCEVIPCPSCPPGILPADVLAQLPVGYVAAEGDVVFVTHPGEISIYTYNGIVWVKNCNCIALGGVAVGDDWGVEYVHNLLGSIATGKGTTTDPLYVPPTNMAVTDTSDINMSITGDGYMSPFTISGTVNEGDPLPMYASRTPGTGPFVISCATLFADTCPTGFTTASYTLVSYPTDVYENVSISGTNLNYSILADAPPGTHYINVNRNCS